jgi:dihydrofolate reductase
MKIVLAIVTSIDGKSTKGNFPPAIWASNEDQKHFLSLISKYSLIVMGGNTYKSVRSDIRLSKNKLRVILTRNPKKFEKDNIPGQLEFSGESPRQLVKRLKFEGYKEMLLVSGAFLNTVFFKEKLIDELYLTIEPKIFGKGKGIIDNTEKLDINLKLISIKKLNSQGTLLLKYKVL